MMRRPGPTCRSVGCRHADRDDHRGVPAGSGRPSPPRWRPPTPCSWPAGRPPRSTSVAERFGATTWPIDLADVDAIAAVVEPIVELDVLIHNAGVAYPGRVAESTVDEWRATMAVNVVGAVALTLALLPALRSAGGHVVFVNSGSGINASPGLASYSASKFALRGFADSLRNDEPVAAGDVGASRPDRHRDAGGPGRLRGPRVRPGAVPQPGDCGEGHRRRGQCAARRPHPRGHRPPPVIGPAD